METENKLKILFVEDVPTDKKLAEMELRKEGFQFISEVVETENDFIKALNEFKPDIIISDYSMPSFDGMQALNIAKELCPSIPFILYTGSINEETAVNCIKAGAWDYIIKERSARLPFAVKETLERKEKIRNLKLTEEKYHTIFESTGTATIIVEDDTTISMVNKECILLTGYTTEEIKGTKWTNYVAPESLDMMMKYDKIRSETPEKAPKKYEANLVNKKGEIRNTILNIGFIAETKQRVVSMLDITEWKQAEEEIRKTKQDWQGIFHGISHPTVILDAQHNILDINDSLREKLGKDISEIKKLKCWDIFHTPGTTCPPFGCPFEQMVLTGTAETNEMEMEAFGGYYLINCTPLFDEEGKLDKVIHIATDITERKKAEEYLKTSEEKYRNLIETMPEGFYRSTAEGYFIDANPALVNMLGYDSKEELMKVHIPEALYFTKDDRYDGVIYSADFRQNTDVYRLKKKDGTAIWVEDYARYIKDSSGNILFHEGILRDVTESLRVHNEILKAKEKAEEANKTKTNFLANMSHEIRTPLNGILGFTEILKNEISNPEHIRYTKIIERSGKRLLDTLHMILTFAKLDAEKQDINYSNVMIEDVINETLQSFQALAKAKNLYLKSTIRTSNRRTKSDENFIRSILNNLVNNAIKYTKTGGIEVELSKVNDSLIIKVRDTGIGIEKNKQEIIFEEFRQESEGFNRSFEGTGLGLSITKRFVELMNGKITVESEPGAGSTFIVELPIVDFSDSINIKLEKKKAGSENYEIIEGDRSKTSILIVENDKDNRTYVESILRKFNTDSAEDGESAIRKTKEKLYDIILMDINLGKGMDGISAVKEIRKLKNYKKTPIVALTAFVLVGDKEEFLSAGCTHYLGKPFEYKQLLELIDNILKNI